MIEIEFTPEELREMGWDGDPDTLESFIIRVKSALALGWDRFEMSLDEFEEQQQGEEELSLNDRRKRAEEAGWDEEEMSLEEFEDYFL